MLHFSDVTQYIRTVPTFIIINYKQYRIYVMCNFVPGLSPVPSSQTSLTNISL